MRTKVGLARGNSRTQNIHEALSLIKEEIEASLRGKRSVLIKPNLTSPENMYANTSIETVEAIIDFINGLKEVEFIIGESSGGAYYAGKNTWDVFRYFGYERIKKDNVSLMSFDDAIEYIRIPVETIHGRDEIRVIKPPCDYMISVAIPKTHDYAIATLSLKNMMGLVFKEDRLKIHGLVSMEDITPAVCFVPKRIQFLFQRILPSSIISLVRNKKTYIHCVGLIHRNLITLFRHIIPDLGVIDGYYGMQGDGPIGGEGIRHGIAIAGLDAVKVDAVGVACMGYMPEEVGYLYYCALEGIGSIAIDDIAGIEDVQIKYKPHRDYKYQKKWKFFRQKL